MPFFVVEPLPDFGEAAAEMYVAIGGRLRNLNPAFAVIAEMFYGRERLVFDTEGLHNHWVPLAESTVEWKNTYGYGNTKILERTGALKASLTHLGAQGSVHKIEESAALSSLYIGTDIDYAKFHEFDKAWGAQGNPVSTRPMIDIDELAASDWAEVLANWVADGVTRAI